MTLGVPVVAANRGALPEVLGAPDAGRVHRSRSAGQCDRIDRRQSPVAESAATKGVRQARRYTNGRRRKLYAAYEAAVDRRAERAGAPEPRCGFHRCARVVRPTRLASAGIVSGLLHQWALEPTARRGTSFVLYAHKPLTTSIGTVLTPAAGNGADFRPAVITGAGVHLVGAGHAAAALRRDRPDVLLRAWVTARCGVAVRWCGDPRCVSPPP